jgi:tetratricopeptide (TPR) repeat protein
VAFAKEKDNMKTIMLLLMLPIVSCNAQKHDKEAVEFNNRAVQFMKVNKLDSALIFINKAIENDSNNWLPYGNKCKILWQMNKNEEALKTVQLAARRIKSSGWLLFQEGLAYEYVGQLEMAKKSYSKSLELTHNYQIDTLPYDQQETIAMLLTFTKGREYGLPIIQQIIKNYGPSLSDFELESVKRMANEIDAYQDGGYLEIQNQEGKRYCIKSEKDIDEFTISLLDKGINIEQRSKNNNVIEFVIKNKFRDKALKLGFQECRK